MSVSQVIPVDGGSLNWSSHRSGDNSHRSILRPCRSGVEAPGASAVRPYWPAESAPEGAAGARAVRPAEEGRTAVTQVAPQGDSTGFEPGTWTPSSPPVPLRRWPYAERVRVVRMLALLPRRSPTAETLMSVGAGLAPAHGSSVCPIAGPPWRAAKRLSGTLAAHRSGIGSGLFSIAAAMTSGKRSGVQANAGTPSSASAAA